MGEGDGPHLSVKHVGAAFMTEPKNELEWHVALTILSTFSTAHVQFVLECGWRLQSPNESGEYQEPGCAAVSFAGTHQPSSFLIRARDWVQRPCPSGGELFDRIVSHGALREADAMDADLILVERPGGIGPIWDAVRDRLCRASADH